MNSRRWSCFYICVLITCNIDTHVGVLKILEKSNWTWKSGIYFLMYVLKLQIAVIYSMHDFHCVNYSFRPNLSLKTKGLVYLIVKYKKIVEIKRVWFLTQFSCLLMKLIVWRGTPLFTGSVIWIARLLTFFHSFSIANERSSKNKCSIFRMEIFVDLCYSCLRL